MNEKEQTPFDELITVPSAYENPTQAEITDDRLEKANFSKHTYNLVKKARRKGKLYKLKLPYLQYDLTKSKPRPKLIAMAVFSAIVMLLSVAGAIYSFVAAALPLIIFSSDATEAVDNMKIPIIDLLGGIGVLALWMVVFVLLTLIIVVIVLLISNTLKLLNFSRGSVEELAYSHEVGDLLSNFGATVFIALAIGIGTLFANSLLGWIFGILIIVIGIVFIAAAIMLAIERRNARKELENTDPRRLESIKNYFADLRKICKRKSFTQSLFGSNRWR